MGRKNSSEINIERLEQEKRGLRIKNIRENELKMNKTQLAKEIGISNWKETCVNSFWSPLYIKCINCSRVELSILS